MMAGTLMKFLLAILATVFAYVAACFTSVAESGGFWQFFWLGTCLASSSSACLLMIVACRQLQ